MPRILFHHRYPYFDTGSPKALVSMMDSIGVHGFESLFIGPDAGQLAKEVKGRGHQVIPGSVDPIDFKHPIETLTNFSNKRKILREHFVDVVHLNEFGWNSDLAVAAWSMNVPVVLHVHNPESVARSNINRLVADHVLTCSRQNIDMIENRHLIRGECGVLYNQVDIETFSSGNSIRERLGISPNQLVVISVAQVCHRKGIDVLIGAAEILRDVHPDVIWLVVGPDGTGEADFAEKMRKTAHERLGDSAIRFLGSRDDIPDLLASSDIFLLATRSEPFGIVIAEAMAAGLPVVASSVGGIPEIIASDELGLLVNEIDSQAFATATATLLEDKEKRDVMAKAAARSVRERFSSQVIGQQLAGFYASLIGKT